MTTSSKENQDKGRLVAALRSWIYFIALCAFVSLGILYLLYGAEFSAVRAVYEAY